MTAHLSSSINPPSPFWSAHVCGTLVLCYQDSDLIVGVSGHFASGCVIMLSLVPSPLHAHARKGLVKRVALTRPAGMQ